MHAAGIFWGSGGQGTRHTRDALRDTLEEEKGRDTWRDFIGDGRHRPDLARSLGRGERLK